MSDVSPTDVNDDAPLDLDAVAADFDRIEAALGDLDAASAPGHEDPRGD